MPDAPASPISFLAFDLEVAKGFPDDVPDWRMYRPLGISCAATVTDQGETTLWYGRGEDGSFQPRMSQPEAARLLAHLQAAVDRGATIVTWNGLGFDFDVLAEESGQKRQCQELARRHIDLMFHFFCLKGFGIGLEKAAKGIGLPGKMEGMRGTLAPVLWQQGQYQKVLDYVAQDASLALQLAQAIEKRRMFAWLNNSGKLQTAPIPQGLLTVERALKLPKPDTSWMRDPWKREKFAGWLDK